MNRYGSNFYPNGRLALVLMTVLAGIVAGGLTRRGEVLGEPAMSAAPPGMLPEVVVTAPRLEG